MCAYTSKRASVKGSLAPLAQWLLPIMTDVGLYGAIAFYHQPHCYAWTNERWTQLDAGYQLWGCGAPRRPGNRLVATLLAPVDASQPREGVSVCVFVFVCSLESSPANMDYC